MGQSIRQVARRQALEAQAKRRRERAAAERRCSEAGADVMVALAERDAAVTRHESAAGKALVALTREEELTLAEACEWAGDLSIAEAKRLRRLVETDEPRSGSVGRRDATGDGRGDEGAA